MTWTLEDAAEAFADYADACDRLNHRLFQGHPLLTSKFIGALIRHFSATGDLLAIENTRGEPGGIVLLTRNGFTNWQTFLPSQAPIPPVLVSADADLRDLIRTLPGPSLAIEWLSQDPLCSTVVPGISLPSTEIVTHVTTMNIQIEQSFEEYWASRSRKLRGNIGRYKRRVDKEGLHIRLDVIDEPEPLIDALGRYGDLESAGWKGRQKTAIHRDNIQGRFYADLLSAHAEFRQARIYELYYNDKLAASRVSIHNDDQLIMLKTTYDESMSRLSPGRLLLHQLLEREFERRKFRTIEFYTNATTDQISWSTGTRDIHHVTQYRSSLIKQLAKKSRALRRQLRR